MNKQKVRIINANDLRIIRARKDLLHWYEHYGRHNLPWRLKASPYAVLISEIMLQQTTVASIIPRFDAWMKRFPCIRKLAEASEQEVLLFWEGLGYYARARRLHKAAQAIVFYHQGHIPTEEKDLLALPGIGTYTAAAIRTFAYDQSAVVLDTNILRVLARWENMLHPIDKIQGRSTLKTIMVAFLPETGCKRIVSALMDLGATICRAGMPECIRCPIQKTCMAVEPEKLPNKSPRMLTSHLLEQRAWFWKNDRLYLEQSLGPLWRGLWILPKLKNESLKVTPIITITYPITRYRITMQIYRSHKKIPSNLQGFTLDKLSTLPIPTPHREGIRKVILALETHQIFS